MSEKPTVGRVEFAPNYGKKVGAGDGDTYVPDVAALQVRIAELEADRARLEWVANSGAEVVRWPLTRTYSVRWDNQETRQRRDYADAIDEAMALQGEGEG